MKDATVPVSDFSHSWVLLDLLASNVLLVSF